MRPGRASAPGVRGCRLSVSCGLLSVAFVSLVASETRGFPRKTTRVTEKIRAETGAAAPQVTVTRIEVPNDPNSRSCDFTMH
jgi:hypothetical protein